MLQVLAMSPAVLVSFGFVMLIGGLLVYLFGRNRAIGSLARLEKSSTQSEAKANPQSLIFHGAFGQEVWWNPLLPIHFGLESFDHGPGSFKACLHDEWRELSKAVRAFLRGLIGGDGLLSTEGETHTHQRKMLMPHFGFGKIKDFVQVVSTHANELCQELKPLADQPNTSVDIFHKVDIGYHWGFSLWFSFQCLVHWFPCRRRHEAFDVSPPSMFYLVGNNFIPTFRSWPLPRLIHEHETKKMLYQTVDVIAAKLKSTRDVNRLVDLVDLLLDENAHKVTFMLADYEHDAVFTLFAQHPQIEAMARVKKLVL
ncbi:hypothetical protein LEN26_000081 [Aphanomyces euteiches]|nr:hypothetical protein AeMF1_016065 [Aphanomyces euteiches]KAH9164341.1 hypothetical protein LEN26_000081 [Aphanomyces euteiches]KAH9184683.1 hypothetical protein AeNC1_013342 [Aphanomyces euteiches]